jgi:positive phototaxis protein PixI
MSDRLGNIPIDMASDGSDGANGDLASMSSATPPTQTITQPADPNLVEYIQLDLNQQIGAAIEMSRADAVISVNAKSIVPIPNMPSCFLGLLNHRGHVYWVIDLPDLLGISPLADVNGNYAAMIVTPSQERSPVVAQPHANSSNSASQMQTGVIETVDSEHQVNRSPLILAVREIAGIVKCDPDQIQVCIPPMPPGLQEYASQCLEYNQEKLYILDLDAIANSAVLQVT